MTSHAFVFSAHPRHHGLWTWVCSCGVHCHDRMFGAVMTWLPFVDAARQAEVHLVAVGADIDDDIVRGESNERP